MGSQLIGLLKGSATVRLSLAHWDCARPMYHGVERRITPRHRGVKPGMIRLGSDNHIKCTVCDFSPAGVGLVLPAAVSILMVEFELTFDETTRHCVTVWRRLNRVGVKIRSTTLAI
jgi:hypothetical protein